MCDKEEWYSFHFDRAAQGLCEQRQNDANQLNIIYLSPLFVLNFLLLNWKTERVRENCGQFYYSFLLALGHFSFARENVRTNHTGTIHFVYSFRFLCRARLTVLAFGNSMHSRTHRTLFFLFFSVTLFSVLLLCDASDSLVNQLLLQT